MDIQQLRYFQAVAQTGSFSSASGALFVTRAAISKSILQLEAELGYPLFNRSRDGVALTPNALRFLPMVTDLINQFDQLELEMKKTDPARTISICVPTSWFDHFSHKLCQFQQMHQKELHLEISTCTDAELSRRLECGNATMAITHLHLKDTLDDGLTVLRTPLVIAMSSKNPLIDKAVLTEADMVDQNVFFYTCGFDSVFWLPTFECKSHTFENDLMFIYSRIFHNEGILPTPLYTIPEFQSGISFVPYQGENDTIETYCYISRSVQADPKLKVLCQQLRTFLAQV